MDYFLIRGFPVELDLLLRPREAVNTLEDLREKYLRLLLVGLLNSPGHPVDPFRRIKPFLTAKRPEAFGGTGCAQCLSDQYPWTLVFIRPARLRCLFAPRSSQRMLSEPSLVMHWPQHFTISAIKD